MTNISDALRDRMVGDGEFDPSCTGKFPHASERAALKSIRPSRRIRARPGVRLGAYRCPSCGFWHLGGK